jgi:lipopolysaccharide transport system ATP-binding protein
VLFISHNMNSIQALCSRAIWLDKGRLRADSTDVRHVAHEYLSGGVSSARGEWINTSPDLSEAFIIPLRIRLIDTNGVVVSTPVANNVELTLELDIEVRRLDPGLIIGYILYAEDGQELWCSGQTDEARDNWPVLHQGRLRLKTTIPPRLLNEGRYTIECICGLCDRSWYFEPGARAATIQFEIQGALSDSPIWTARRSGLLAPVWLWHVAQSSKQTPDGNS